jgi:folate-dependent phosphoribosylglycinamide formyltransferase PurN
MSRTLSLAGVVVEDKSRAPMTPDASADDRVVIECHLAGRDRVERALLGEPSGFAGYDLFDVGREGVNDAAVERWVSARSPDAVILYGASIVTAPLLERFAGRIINLHLGLSPYYRGSATNFWPLVHRVPECVGATIHLAVSRVDAGAILVQVRPDAAADDGPHELGTRALVAALDVLPETVSRYLDGSLAPVEQNLTVGRVCRTGDFNAGAVRTMHRHFETGMMTEYLRNAAERCARYPLVGIAARAS